MMMTEERQGLAFEAGNCGCDVSCTVATQTNYPRLQRSVNLLGVSRREIGRPGKAASQALRLAYTRRSLCLKYLSRNLSNGLFFTEQLAHLAGSVLICVHSSLRSKCSVFITLNFF